MGGREKAGPWGQALLHQPGSSPPIAGGVWGHVPTWPSPQHTVFSLWASASSKTGVLVRGPLPAQALRVLGPGQLPLAGAEHGAQAPPRPRWDRWATRAEGLGLLEPRQHTCVSNLLLSALRACLLRPSPSLLALGCNQFGWRTADARGRGDVWGAVGAGNHFGGFVTCQQLAARLRGRGVDIGTLAVPRGQECWSGTWGRAAESAPGAPAAGPTSGLSGLGCGP